LASKGKGVDGYASLHIDRGLILNLVSAQESLSVLTESNNVHLSTLAFGSTLHVLSSTPTFSTLGFGSTITSTFNCLAMPGSRSSPFALLGSLALALDQFRGLRMPDPGFRIPVLNSATLALSTIGLALLVTKGSSSIFRATSPIIGNICGI